MFAIAAGKYRSWRAAEPRSAGGSARPSPTIAAHVAPASRCPPDSERPATSSGSSGWTPQPPEMFSAPRIPGKRVLETQQN